MDLLKEYFADIRTKLSDREESKRVMALGLFALCDVVAFVMTIMNIVTSKGWLTVATGTFSFLMILNLALLFMNKNGEKAALILFTIEVFVMFNFFLISGNPEGFSSLWIPMLCSFGMLFYGRAVGTLISAAMWLDLIFFLWTPLGNSFLLYEYTESFKMRFPVLYIAYYFLALLFEILRAVTFERMLDTQKKYKMLSMHDNLTGLLNRQGLRTEIKNKLNDGEEVRVGFIIFDLDKFKRINDTYGHLTGDVVLCEFADLLDDLDMDTCRWGGEEFAGVFFNDNVTEQDLEEFRLRVEGNPFNHKNGDDIRLTVSAGVVTKMVKTFEEIERMTEDADVALYRAKNAGRNKVVYFN